MLLLSNQKVEQRPKTLAKRVQRMIKLFACLAIASLILLQGYTSPGFLNEVKEKTEIGTAGTLLKNEVKEKIEIGTYPLLNNGVKENTEIGTGTLLATIGSTVEEKQVATFLVEEEKSPTVALSTGNSDEREKVRN
jgi:hypothetical protein